MQDGGCDAYRSFRSNLSVKKVKVGGGCGKFVFVFFSVFLLGVEGIRVCGVTALQDQLDALITSFEFILQRAHLISVSLYKRKERMQFRKGPGWKECSKKWQTKWYNEKQSNKRANKKRKQYQKNTTVLISIKLDEQHVREWKLHGDDTSLWIPIHQLIH